MARREPSPPQSAPRRGLKTGSSLIRLDNVCAQHGRQVLFLGASVALHRGEKVGLVGPNGAGKSTLFRYVMKEEEPDEGNVSVDRGVKLGYFRQDAAETK